MNPQSTNSKTIDLIKSFEGFSSKAYQCSAGHWTIGYGTTSGIQDGMEITEDHAEDLLISDLERIEKAIAPLIEYECNNNQFSALCSLVYNIGIHAFLGSRLLKKLNSGDIEGAADEFLRWDHIDGIASHGLLNRRYEERKIFLSREINT